jgi:hypothetical protein
VGGWAGQHLGWSGGVAFTGALALIGLMLVFGIREDHAYD